MNKLLAVLIFLALTACQTSGTKEGKNLSGIETNQLPDIKVPVYAWLSGPRNKTDQELKRSIFRL